MDVSSSPYQQTSPWPKLGVRWPVVGALVGALLLAFCLDLALGSVTIPLGNVVRVLLGGDADKETWNQIILSLRLPRALTAILAGSALAVAGLQMQTLFRNPLADPFILGISSGASLGVALAVLAAGVGESALLAGFDLLGDARLALAATLGAAAAFVLVVGVSRSVESNVTLLIIGLMFGYATSAIVSILLHFSIAERIHAYVVWTFGSFSGVDWAQMRVLAPVVLVGLAVAGACVKPLNALLLGEAYARSMGLSIERARFVLIASTSLLAGAVTAFCGPIGFVGIAVPHLARGLLGTSDHRVLMPSVVLTGACVALLADLASQMPGTDTVLPLNSVTALLGAPVVIAVILRQRNLRTSL